MINHDYIMFTLNRHAVSAPPRAIAAPAKAGADSSSAPADQRRYYAALVSSANFFALDLIRPWLLRLVYMFSDTAAMMMTPCTNVV